tara:strand:- start:3466 stop:3942 length:477 start_codon:yes stop_codon:yes gene_type:complete
VGDDREEMAGGVRSSGSGESIRAESRHDCPVAHSVSLAVGESALKLDLKLSVNGLGQGRLGGGPAGSVTRKAAKLKPLKLGRFTCALGKSKVVAVDATASIAMARSQTQTAGPCGFLVSRTVIHRLVSFFKSHIWHASIATIARKSGQREEMIRGVTK